MTTSTSTSTSTAHHPPAALALLDRADHLTDLLRPGDRTVSAGRVVDALLDLASSTDDGAVRSAVHDALRRFGRRQLVASEELAAAVDHICAAVVVEDAFAHLVLG